MNGLKRAVVITAIAVMGLAACGDDSKSPVGATTPAPVGTEAMTENTTAMTHDTAVMTEHTAVMTDDTAVMTDSTEVMSDSSTSTTGG